MERKLKLQLNKAIERLENKQVGILDVKIKIFKKRDAIRILKKEKDQINKLFSGDLCLSLKNANLAIFNKVCDSKSCFFVFAKSENNLLNDNVGYFYSWDLIEELESSEYSDVFSEVCEKYFPNTDYYEKEALFENIVACENVIRKFIEEVHPMIESDVDFYMDNHMEDKCLFFVEKNKAISSLKEVIRKIKNCINDKTSDLFYYGLEQSNKRIKRIKKRISILQASNMKFCTVTAEYDVYLDEFDYYLGNFIKRPFVESFFYFFKRHKSILCDYVCEEIAFMLERTKFELDCRFSSL